MLSFLLFGLLYFASSQVIQPEAQASFSQGPGGFKVTGSPSGTWDDAKSTAICPDGYVATECNCLGDVCEGEYFADSNRLTGEDFPYAGDVCVAHRRSGGSGTVTAEVTCDIGTANTVNVEASANGNGCDNRFGLRNMCSGQRTATCPAGYTATDCNCASYWIKCPAESSWTLTGNTCSFSSSGNAVAQVRCQKDDDDSAFQAYGSPSGTGDDAKSTATCPDGYVATECNCLGDVCEAEYFADSNNRLTGEDSPYAGDVCVAHRRGGSQGRVYAEVACDIGTANTVNVEASANGNGCDNSGGLLNMCSGQRTATCPAGYTATDCNCASYWIKCPAESSWTLTGNTCSFSSSGKAVAQVRCEEEAATCTPVDVDPLLDCDSPLKGPKGLQKQCKASNGGATYMDREDAIETWSPYFKAQGCNNDNSCFCNRLKFRKRSPMRARLEAFYTAALINVIDGNIAECNCVRERGCEVDTVGELLSEIEKVIQKQDASDDALEEAAEWASAITTGLDIVECD